MEAKERVNLTFPYYGHYLVDYEEDSVFLAEVAVWPEVRRAGHFTRLIKELKFEYSTIITPVPGNAIKQVLERWGFEETTEFDENLFEDVSMMVWRQGD